MTSALHFNVFDAPEKPVVGDRPHGLGAPMAWDPMTSTLIYGEHEAVLVDPLTTVSEAEALAAWVKLHDRDLVAIYITHGHLDHFAGLTVLLRHFPGARGIATPKSVEFARTQPVRFYRQRLPGQLPATITLPEPYPEESIILEGEELRIIEQGHSDAPDTTSLHVPSLDLVVGGDVLYNQCHQYVAELTPAFVESWLAAVDRLEALGPTIAIAGHKKTGVPDTPECLRWTKRYLTDFARLKDETSGERELFEAMGELYPDWASPQSWLMFGMA
ncbi:MBL fold metallo-hydrolase [Streptomyces bauhiniae]|uniref:MBL fold metallo-hydrolase n=1 Tax=Streptomyces bauhiniae TaxID=2340725 RepID=UPI003647B85A